MIGKEMLPSSTEVQTAKVGTKQVGVWGGHGTDQVWTLREKEEDSFCTLTSPSIPPTPANPPSYPSL